MESEIMPQICASSDSCFLKVLGVSLRAKGIDLKMGKARKGWGWHCLPCSRVVWTSFSEDGGPPSGEALLFQNCWNNSPSNIFGLLDQSDFDTGLHCSRLHWQHDVQSGVSTLVQRLAPGPRVGAWLRRENPLASGKEAAARGSAQVSVPLRLTVTGAESLAGLWGMGRQVANRKHSHFVGKI